MFNKKILLIIMTFTILFSCFNKNIYTSYKFRFKVIIPEGWIALNSGMNKNKENEFKEKLDNERIVQNNKFFENYKYVDIAVYNPESKPPLYEFITVKTEARRLDFSAMIKDREKIQETLYNQLMQSFEGCKTKDFNILDIKRGKALRFEYIVLYRGVEYLVSSVIILGGLTGTYFVNGFCRVDSKDTFLEHFDNLVYNFEKF